MSRTEKTNDRYTIAYGVDHIEGLFIQVFEKGEDDPIVDKCYEIHKIRMDDVVNIAGEYGFDLSAELVEDEIDYGDAS